MLATLSLALDFRKLPDFDSISVSVFLVSLLVLTYSVLGSLSFVLTFLSNIFDRSEL